MQAVGQLVAVVGRAEKSFHNVEALVDGLGVFQREKQPAVQQARPHRGDGAVQHAQQALASLFQRAYKLEVAHCEAVKPHIFLLLDARYGSDVADAGVLGDVEIVQDDAGGYHRVVHAVEAEAFQRRRTELGAQPFAGGVERKEPVVKFKQQVFVAQCLLCPGFQSAFHQHLLRRHVGHDFVNIVGRTFRRQELARRYVEEGYTYTAFAEVQGGQEVVLAVRQHVVVLHHAGCNQFGDAALYKFFGQLGILELLADGHSLARADQFRQIGVERVVWKSGQFHMLRRTVCAARQGDAEDFRSRDGVV